MSNDSTNILFGKRLRELREEKGLLQEDVGNWFNMRKSTVSQWESGRLPHATIIVELAKRLNVSTDYLLGIATDRKQHNISPIATHQAEKTIDDLPSEAIERIEEFKELMRIKYGKKTKIDK